MATPSPVPSKSSGQSIVTLHLRLFTWCFAALITGLLAASVVAYTLHRYGIKPSGYWFFYVDREMNLPSFFSSAQLLLTGALLTAITSHKRAQHDRFAIQWGLLAAGFLFLALDEAVQIHELLNLPMRRLLGGSDDALYHPTVVHPGEPPLKLLFSAWVLPALVGVLLVGILYVRFLAHLSPPRRREFIFAGAVFVGGAVGAEMIGGWYAELHGYQSLGYAIETHVEEGMEMVGILLFNRSLLKVIADSGERYFFRVQT